MGLPVEKYPITPEEYLEIDRKAEIRSEYYNGEMFSMAGASRWHNLLAGKMYTRLSIALETTKCQPYMSDMRLQLEQYNQYTYPDVMVICSEEAFLDKDIARDATVIIEVLSPSTESYDRGDKFHHYQSLTSFQEYILVSQDKMQVDFFQKKDSQKWVYQSLSQPEDQLKLKSAQFNLSLADLYKSISF